MLWAEMVLPVFQNVSALVCRKNFASNVLLRDEGRITQGLAQLCCVGALSEMYVIAV